MKHSSLLRTLESLTHQSPLLRALNRIKRLNLKLALFGSIFSVWDLIIGLYSCHKGDRILGVIMLLVCLFQAFVAFICWRVDVIQRTPDWQGDRWLKPRKNHNSADKI